jgi:hypothetical protein
VNVPQQTREVSVPQAPVQQAVPAAVQEQLTLALPQSVSQEAAVVTTPVKSSLPQPQSAANDNRSSTTTPADGRLRDRLSVRFQGISSYLATFSRNSEFLNPVSFSDGNERVA